MVFDRSIKPLMRREAKRPPQQACESSYHSPVDDKKSLGYPLEYKR
jgi:hypothetical protein